MKRNLKWQISKICQEISLRWPQAFPLALLRIRIQPRSEESPYEIIYGRPYQTISGESHVIGNSNLKEYVLSLGKELSVLHRFVI